VSEQYNRPERSVNNYGTNLLMWQIEYLY